MPRASEPKTRPTDVPVPAFVATVEPADRRAEADAIVARISAATGIDPVMWGESIVGWGSTSMTYAGGGSAPWPALGYSPRKTAHTLYFLHGFGALTDELTRLGPHRLGRGCLYIRRLSDVDPAALTDLVTAAWELDAAR